MVRRASAACVILLAVLAAPLGAQTTTPTEDSLKVAHQTVMSAITSGNPAMLVPMLDRSGVGFFRDSQAIVTFGAGYGPQEAIPSVLTDLAQFSVAEYDAVYRVVGATGVVCMAAQMQPKKGQKARYVRSTWVYASLDGTWRLLSWHTSDAPLKK